MKKKNTAAVALGRMAKGKPKKYTTEQLAVLTERLTLARKKRWPTTKQKGQHNET